MCKVLITDGLQYDSIKELEEEGYEVVNRYYEKDILGEKLRDFDVVVVRSKTKITKGILDVEKGGKLKLIIRAGVGVDNIDLKSANEIGVIVKNTPNSSSNSVAELTLAHIFAVARFVGTSNYTMRNGEWNKDIYKGTEILGKTLGIIGMGRIGRVLAEKSKAIGMDVIYNDSLGKQKDLEYEFLELRELLKKSDFVSLNIPFDKENKFIIGKEELNIMKKGSYIINCARGKLIDENALLEALDNGVISGVGIDVFETEPNINLALVNHPRVSCTPHIGGSTVEAQENIGKEVVSVIKDFFK